MPRDFVPCVYHEREMYDEITQAWHRRYEVIECFAGAEIATHHPCMSMTRNSQAFHVGYTQTPWVHANVPPEASARVDQHERARLFTTFYAAMAALE